MIEVGYPINTLQMLWNFVSTASVAMTINSNGYLVFPDGQITSDGTNFIIDGASGKEVIVSSARDVRLIIDDNNDDTNNEFQIFKHNDDSASNKILSLTQAGALTINGEYTFPTSDGSANQVLQTDGSGNLSFATVSGGGGVSISNNVDNRVLTGDGSNANAEANLTFDGSTLTVTGDMTMAGSSPTLSIPAHSGIEIDITGSASSGNIRANTDLYLLSQTAGLHLGAGGTNSVLRLDTSGNVMIGNSSAAAKLDIRQDSGYAIRAENGSGHYFRVAATGQVEITNNAVDGTASLLLNCTEDSALASPILEFNRDTGSAADADYLGQIKFTGENDADQSVLYAKITGKIQDASDTTEDGIIEFMTKKAGANNISARLKSDKLELINGTSLEVAGNATVTGNTTITGNLTVNGTTTTLNTATLDVEDKNITLNKGSGDTSASANGAGITIQDAVDASNDATILWDASNDEFDFSHGITLPDDKRLKFGAGNDLQILHNGTDSFITNYTSDLYITNTADDKDIVFRSDDGSGSYTTYFRLDGSQSKTVFEKHIQLFDSQRAQFGNGGDFYIQHDGTDNHIISANGHINISNQADDSDIYFKSDDGSGGVTTYFFIDGSDSSTRFTTNPLKFNDSVELQIGTSADLKIYHNGSNSYISDTGTGELGIGSDFLRIMNGALTENMATFAQDGAVTLFHNNSAKLATTSTGVSITGDIESTGKFHVDTADSTLPNTYFSAERFNDSNGKLIFGVGEFLQAAEQLVKHSLVITIEDCI